MDAAHTLVAQIDSLIADGQTFEELEEYLEGRRDLSTAAKNALWLYAWVATDPDSRRKAVTELVAASSGLTLSTARAKIVDAPTESEAVHESDREYSRRLPRPHPRGIRAHRASRRAS